MKNQSIKTSLCAMSLAVFMASSTPVLAGSYDDLILASQKGNWVAMDELFAKGLDPDSTDRAGNSLLTIAAMENNEPLVKMLIRYNAKLSSRNIHGETALQLAAYRGFDNIVRLLLDVGARQDVPGWPPLVYAVYNSHEKIVDMLLQAGADRDATAPNGMTALMFAIQGRKVRLAQRLIDAGANPDIATDKGETAYSLSLKSQDPELTRIIDTALENWRLQQLKKSLSTSP